LRGLRLILDNPALGRLFVLRDEEQVPGMANALVTASTAEGGRVLLLEGRDRAPGTARRRAGEAAGRTCACMGKTANPTCDTLSRLLQNLLHRFFHSILIPCPCRVCAISHKVARWLLAVPPINCGARIEGFEHAGTSFRRIAVDRGRARRLLAGAWMDFSMRMRHD